MKKERAEWMKPRRILPYVLLVLFFAFIAVQYWNYAMVAKSTVPIMDFWHWTAIYGEDVWNGTISLSDYFFSDAGEHMQPFAMALQFGVLKASRFDVVPLVTWGVALRIVIAGFLGVVFFRRYWQEEDNGRKIILVICTGAIMMSPLNYNQWEMAMEPFSLGNACRVLMYYLSFLWIDQFVREFPNRKYRTNLLLGALLGVYCAFLTIFVGSAYFVGHLPAIGLVLLWVLWRHRAQWKEYLGPLAAWCIISFIGACVYYGLFTAGGRGASSTESEHILLLLLEGVAMFWGSLFLPQTLCDTLGVAPFCILGTLVLVYAIYITIRYLNTAQAEQNTMPVICVLYAIIIATMICWGRIGRFGPDTMISSRYVIESSIGLVGILWMTYGVFIASARTRRVWCKSLAVTLVTIILLSYSAKIETGIAPYRKIYNDNLKELMWNIDDYSDEELGVTQGSAEDVRFCVAFFRENNLSIFYQATEE